MARIRKRNVTQWIRGGDVFILAPYLYYVSRNPALPTRQRKALEWIAIGIFVYNGANLIRDMR